MARPSALGPVAAGPALLSLPAAGRLSGPVSWSGHGPRSVAMPPRPPAQRSAPMPSAKVGPQLAARRVRMGPTSQPQGLGLPTLLAVGLLVLVAATLAPERPQDQAAICQRHNGPVACRVW